MVARFSTSLKRYFSTLLSLWGRTFLGCRIPVLLYHSVDRSGSVISISPERFRDQMRYLKEAGYETISLNNYLDYVSGRQQPGGKKVVITFDDGFQNNYTVAFPVLKALGLTATVFLATDHVGGSSDWKRDPSIPELPMMTWSQIEKMNGYGIRFESHACGHRYLSQLSDDEIKRELLESKQVIEEKTGRSVEFFCHPYGDWSERTKNLVRQCGYRGAFTRPGFRSFSSSKDLYDLKRVGTNQFSCLEDFKAGLLGAYDWVVLLKESLGIRRIRDLGVGR